MSDCEEERRNLSHNLQDLWELPIKDRDDGINLLCKIFNNISNNPNESKYRDLNFIKIHKKFEKCKPAFNLLFIAGFKKSKNGERLQLHNDSNTLKIFESTNNSFQELKTAMTMSMDINNNNNNNNNNFDKYSWKCTFCTFKNTSSMRFCEMCGALNLSQMFETTISQNSQCYKMNNKSLKYDLISNCQSLNRITNILNDKHKFFKNV